MSDQFPDFTTTDPKDPLEVLNYTEDWSDWLGDATIASVVWTVPDGITKDTEAHTDTTATIRLSGGTRGNDYLVRCQITDSDTEIGVRSIKVPVRDR